MRGWITNGETFAERGSPLALSIRTAPVLIDAVRVDRLSGPEQSDLEAQY